MKLKDLQKNQLQKLHNGKKTNALFRLERKLNFSNLIGFAVIGALFVVLTILSYSLLNDMFADMLSTVQPEMKEFLESFLGTGDFSSFFVSQVGSTWALISLIFSAYLGYNLVASNFNQGSSSVLYTLNYSRNKVLSHKYARMVINTTLLNAFLFASSLTTIAVMNYSISYLNFGLFALGIWLASVLVGTVVFGLSALNHKKLSAALVILLPTVMFMASIMFVLSDSLAWLSYLSPASIFINAQNSVLYSGLSAVNYWVLVLWAGLAVATLLLGLQKFNKKDLI